MIHPAHQLNLALSNFSLLPSNSKSSKYQNLPTTPRLGLLDKIKIFLNPGAYFEELHQMYPYHNVLNTAYETYHEDKANATKNGLIISAISMYIPCDLVSLCSRQPGEESFCLSSTSTGLSSTPTESSGTTFGLLCFQSLCSTWECTGLTEKTWLLSGMYMLEESNKGTRFVM